MIHRLGVFVAILLLPISVQANDFYTHGSFPSPSSPATSASMRAELDLISAGFDRLPALSGNANRLVVINSAGNGLTVSSGTLSLAGTWTITGAYATTLTATANTTLVLPSVSGTLATLAGTESFSGKSLSLGANTVTGTLAQFNTALSDGDFCSLTGTESLSGKTLVSPIFSGTITGTYALTGSFSLTSPIITTPSISAPILSGGGTLGGTYSGTYTLSGPTVSAPTFSGASSGSLTGFAATNAVFTTSTVAANPATALGIAPKQYVDARAVFPRGYIWGCTLSNNGSDATNDIDLASSCDAVSVDSAATSRVLFAPGALTKRLDATWAAGTNQGGRSSSLSIANGTWHVCLIRVAGVDDFGFDTSATCSNLVIDHAATNVRRIGSVLRESGAIVPFSQWAGKFLRTSPVLSIDVAIAATTANTRTLSVPTGIIVEALITHVFVQGASNNYGYVSSLDQTDLAPSTTVAPLHNRWGHTFSGGLTVSDSLQIRTNTSGQIRTRWSAADGSERIVLNGWIDDRGENQ